MTNKESEERKKQNYKRRLLVMREEHNLPHLTKEQLDQLLNRLLLIPGSVDDVDLRPVLRLFCREMKCTQPGPIYV